MSYHRRDREEAERCEMEKERIGFVGLGTMGIPMVQNLLRGGYQVTVWNRSSDKYAAIQDSGLDAGVRVAVGASC